VRVEHKRLTGVQVKAADRGEVLAVVARFNVVDADGDVTSPEAFEVGAVVPVSAYQHTSWTGQLPVGKATIRADGEKAWAEAQFFMTTSSGRDTFEVVKQLGPLGQWSYGFDVVESEFVEVKGRRVRLLKKLRVHEVSPVLIGAGVGVTTQSAKDVLPAALHRELVAIADRFHRERVVRARLALVRSRLRGVA
jgi:hypothetical protein